MLARLYTTPEDVASCAYAPGKVEPNPEITNSGVFYSFIITALVSTVFSVIITWTEHSDRKSFVIRKLLLSLSDQQIITGIGSMTLGLITMDRLFYYQFHILWMASLLSNITHANTIVALADEIRSDWVRRWLRLIVIFINFFLSITFGIIIILTRNGGRVYWNIPVNCLFDLPKQDVGNNDPEVVISPAIVIAIYVTVFLISLGFIRFSLMGRSRILLLKLICHFIFTTVGIIATISTLYDITFLTQRNSSKVGVWGFGDVLPLMLLILPIISALDLYREKLKAREIQGEPRQQELLENRRLSQIRSGVNACLYVNKPRTFLPTLEISRKRD